MTIVTKPLTDKKDLKPLVIDADPRGYPNAPPDEPYVPTNTEDITVYQHPYRKHRAAFLVLLGLLLTLLLACAICGGVYLFYMYNRPEVYRERCTLRIPQALAAAESQYGQPAYPTVQSVPDVQPPRFQLARNRMLLPDIDNSPFDLNKFIDSFQQDFELDLQRQLYEIFQIPRVPRLGMGRPARFIHDFSLNLTGILDMDSQECYVMPLNRSVVKPPQDMFDFIRGLEDGTYTVDRAAVSKTYVVDPVPIEDTSDLGRYISKECYGLPIFNLIPREEASSDRVKRAAESGKTLSFTEFSGTLQRIKILRD